MQGHILLSVPCLLLLPSSACGLRWAKGATSPQWWSYLPSAKSLKVTQQIGPSPQRQSPIFDALQECRTGTNMCPVTNAGSDSTPSQEEEVEDGSVG